ncbi:transposase [Streptomyces sp. NPDC051310]|uniref:transposase n=1 Tax=Streptomyces sp. NPDC051310 TaxID=3365649 RepID=UPI0037A3E17C
MPSWFLPRSGTGWPRANDRVVLNGIVWKLRTGSAWRDVPERYGSWQTLYARFRRWALDGTFSRMLEQVQAEKDAAIRSLDDLALLPNLKRVTAVDDGTLVAPGKWETFTARGIEAS